MFYSASSFPFPQPTGLTTPGTFSSWCQPHLVRVISKHCFVYCFYLCIYIFCCLLTDWCDVFQCHPFPSHILDKRWHNRGSLRHDWCVPANYYSILPKKKKMDHLVLESRTEEMAGRLLACLYGGPRPDCKNASLNRQQQQQQDVWLLNECSQVHTHTCKTARAHTCTQKQKCWLHANGPDPSHFLIRLYTLPPVAGWPRASFPQHCG